MPEEVLRKTKNSLNQIKILRKQDYCKGGRFKAAFGYDVIEAVKEKKQQKSVDFVCFSLVLQPVKSTTNM